MYGYGKLAQSIGKELPLEVLKSHAGYYIGTREDGMPFTRESIEYFPTTELAQAALESGEWTQKPSL